MLTVDRLTCNHQAQPLGIDDPRPFFSWQLRSRERGQFQAAYRLLVASTPALLSENQGDLWDSGQVTTSECLQIRYSGRSLASRGRCYWKVKVWDAQGRQSPWSQPAWFELGLLQPEDWQAHWIAHPDASWEAISPAPFFRRSFYLEHPPEVARVYICGLGCYELYVNGSRVDDRVLDPAFTRYDRRVLYAAYDVTPLLREGDNVFGVVLGNGLYNQAARDAWYFEKAPWRASPRLLFQAHIASAGRREMVLTSDASWQVTTGPICFDGLRLGEVYDARLELPGWAAPGYDDSGWRAARLVEAPRGRPSAQYQPPARVMSRLSVVKSWMTTAFTTVLDFGQNFAGWARLRFTGPAGAEVRLVYGELLSPKGRVDQGNINTLVYEGEVQVDRYILKGGSEEVYEPRFTYHGFQYLEIEAPSSVHLVDAEGCVVHTAFQPAGMFDSSSELLGQIQSAVEWSYISNFAAGYPTDCPHREKNGWTGDTHLAAEAGLYNYDAALAYWKWLDDLADEQREDGSLPGIVPTSGWGYQWGNGPCWDSACILIPWYLYLYRGDRAILERTYPMMVRYLEYLYARSGGSPFALGLGDWLPPFGAPEDYTAPLAVLSSAYYYMDARVLAQVADLLGHTEDARRFDQWAAQMREGFNRRFYDPASGLYAGGSQTAQGMAIYAGLVDPAEQPKVARQLVRAIQQQKGRLNAGIHGAKAVPNALAQSGFYAAALDLFTQPEYPGWAWWMAQGATSLWESWNGADSRNHIAFGDVSAWCFKYLAGIQPDPQQPGFKHTIIRPYMAPELDWVRAEHASAYGMIFSMWQRAAGQYQLEVRLPANTSGVVYLPRSAAGSVRVDGAALDQSGLQFSHQRTGEIVISLGSGDWMFNGAFGGK
jgi:alpha-L-rhamnosidase